jgi:hypothetical protein
MEPARLGLTDTEGAVDGAIEGPLLGLCECRIVGASLGSTDVCELGATLETSVGFMEPATLGLTDTDGIVDGALEGSTLGIPENKLGADDCTRVGIDVGNEEGTGDGFSLGLEDGLALGRLVGVAVGRNVGLELGNSDGFAVGYVHVSSKSAHAVPKSTPSQKLPDT